MINRNGKIYLTREEAAEAAHCHKGSVERWQRKGLIMQAKFGARIYVPESEIPRIKKMAKREDSICWDCIRSAAPKELSCIWDKSRGKTPVKGCSIKFVNRSACNGASACVVGIVTECPLFVSLYEDDNLDKIRRLRRCAEV